MELPGGVVKRKSGALGGPETEHTQIMGKEGKRILGRPEKRSSGYHQEKITNLDTTDSVKYSDEAKEYRRQRLEEDLAETGGSGGSE